MFEVNESDKQQFSPTARDFSVKTIFPISLELAENDIKDFNKAAVIKLKYEVEKERSDKPIVDKVFSQKTHEEAELFQTVQSELFHLGF